MHASVLVQLTSYLLMHPARLSRHSPSAYHLQTTVPLIVRASDLAWPGLALFLNRGLIIHPIPLCIHRSLLHTCLDLLTSQTPTCARSFATSSVTNTHLMRTVRSAANTNSLTQLAGVEEDPTSAHESRPTPFSRVETSKDPTMPRHQLTFRMVVG